MTFLRLSGSRCTQATISYIQAFRLQCDGRRLLGHRSRQLILPAYRKNVHLLSTNSTTSSILHSSGSVPSYCPGCGARSQTSDKSEAGHYSLTRSAVKSYLGHDGSSSSKESEENAIFASALQDHRKDVIQQASAGAQPIQKEEKTKAPVPICDRCHNLLHHNGGTPTHHPSINSLEELISSSPFKYNHIYHVIDAADFPMSLVSNLTHRLHVASMRTQNRRSKHRRFSGNRSAEVSFIITRSDLLAGKKEQVDSLMPYLQDVLRRALGYRDKLSRLGNVICVSSKRGWWTKNLKESIWQRGGAGWMVGKVNVGKSNLFEAIFPKGRARMNVSLELDAAPTATSSQLASIQSSGRKNLSESRQSKASSQLPPPQVETNYPVMPIISALPGTTVSPIRVPFGSGKGELIDLPGLRRGELEEYVKPELRQDLIMKSRIVSERFIVKPDRSLLLGCLIRITPVTPELNFIMHPFVNLHPHSTATDKAAEIHSGARESGISSVAEKHAGPKMASAGKIRLKWDVTKKFAGPLTTKSAAAFTPEQLPFIVFGVDVLIEGYGWVEVVAQVRRKAWNEAQRISRVGKHNAWPPSANNSTVEGDTAPYPEVEVFSPEGRFIGSRRPMGASLFQRKRPVAATRRKTRPRMSMKSVRGRRVPGTPAGSSTKAA